MLCGFVLSNRAVVVGSYRRVGALKKKRPQPHAKGRRDEFSVDMSKGLPESPACMYAQIIVTLDASYLLIYPLFASCPPVGTFEPSLSVCTHHTYPALARLSSTPLTSYAILINYHRIMHTKPMMSENESCDIDVAGSAGLPTVPRQAEEHEQLTEKGGRYESSMRGDGVDASCCDWPPQDYESSVLHVVKEEDKEGDEGDRGGKRRVVEEKVVLEYEGRRLTLRTLLEEDELAPLFDGAYWPGTMVWPVSLWTAEYIHHTYRKHMRGARVVELGCGCGVPGMLCHLMGAASVALTEQPELMRIIRQNIKENFGVEGGREKRREGGTATNGKEEKNGACRGEEAHADLSPPSSPLMSIPPSSTSSLFAAPLWWSREAALDLLEQNEWPAVDFAVCCDCIYAPFWGESYKALLACFEEFSARSPSTCIGIISVERRNGDGVDDFLACARATMEVKQVQHDQARGWFIYELRAKSL